MENVQGGKKTAITRWAVAAQKTESRKYLLSVKYHSLTGKNEYTHFEIEEKRIENAV